MKNLIMMETYLHILHSLFFSDSLLWEWSWWLVTETKCNMGSIGDWKIISDCYGDVTCGIIDDAIMDTV